MPQSFSESQILGMVKQAGINYVKEQQVYKEMENKAKEVAEKAGNWAKKVFTPSKGSNNSSEASEVVDTSTVPNTTEQTAPPAPKMFHWNASVNSVKAYLESTTDAKWSVCASATIKVSFSGLTPHFDVRGVVNGSGTFQNNDTLSGKAQYSVSSNTFSCNVNYNSPSTGIYANGSYSVSSGGMSYGVSAGYNNGPLSVGVTWSGGGNNSGTISLSYNF